MMNLNMSVAEVKSALAQTWGAAGTVNELPSAGTRLAVGSAVIEVSDEPHTGCEKFHARYGGDAHRFVNTRAHRGLNLRGINARVVEPGVVRRGDAIRKL